MKSGFVSIIGRPNVGKSTLLNTLLDTHIAIVSNVAGTTRNAIQGVYNDDEAQIIFIDTPGIHKPQDKLGKYLNKQSYESLEDVDAILFVVDATKDLLVKVLEYRPFLVKPNNHELGEIFGVTLETREAVVPYAKKLQEMGARNVLVSMAGEGAVLVAEDGQVYEAPAPKGNLVNGVGAGDSMVAGFMYGYFENRDYLHAFRMGLATGSASAFSEYLATREEVEAVYRQFQ